MVKYLICNEDIVGSSPIESYLFYEHQQPHRPSLLVQECVPQHHYDRQRGKRLHRPYSPVGQMEVCVSERTGWYVPMRNCGERPLRA